MKNKSKRNHIVGVRARHDFVKRFDEVCAHLGYNRSEVIRFCLNKFINEHSNNPEKIIRSSSEMF